MRFSFSKNTYQIPDQILSHSDASYFIEEQQDRGGHAAVFKCVSEEDGEPYAVKVLMSPVEKKVQRFANEASLLSSINHPHIIKYIDSGQLDVRKDRGADFSAQFIVMELAEKSLETYLKEKNFQIEPTEYLAQLRGLADALSKIHSLGALHRDIKPSNILVNNDRWLISDFGLCRIIENDSDLTLLERQVGPRYWMSPESNNRAIGVNGPCADIVKASDVYQLASVFWLIVNGSHPTGIMDYSDWNGPRRIFLPIFSALQYGLTRRISSGEDFYDQMVRSIVVVQT